MTKVKLLIQVNHIEMELVDFFVNGFKQFTNVNLITHFHRFLIVFIEKPNLEQIKVGKGNQQHIRIGGGINLEKTTTRFTFRIGKGKHNRVDIPFDSPLFPLSDDVLHHILRFNFTL